MRTFVYDLTQKGEITGTKTEHIVSCSETTMGGEPLYYVRKFDDGKFYARLNRMYGRYEDVIYIADSFAEVYNMCQRWKDHEQQADREQRADEFYKYQRGDVVDKKRFLHPNESVEIEGDIVERMAEQFMRIE